MLALKNTAAMFLLSLLLTACVHTGPRDSSLHQQIVGTWSQGASAEITFLSDGRFHSEVKRTASDARLDGTWNVKKGALVILTKHVTESYKPWATHLESISGSPNPVFYKVLAIDHVYLTIHTEDGQMGSKTNFWERKG